MTEFLTISLHQLSLQEPEAERLYGDVPDQYMLKKLTEIAYNYGQSIGHELMYIYPATTINQYDGAIIVFKKTQEQPA